MVIRHIFPISGLGAPKPALRPVSRELSSHGRSGATNS
jgi:hypothetical protein